MFRPTGRIKREPGVNPGRSRRCIGEVAHIPLVDTGKEDATDDPESEDLRQCHTGNSTRHRGCMIKHYTRTSCPVFYYLVSINEKHYKEGKK
jgi:hypothetical protein